MLYGRQIDLGLSMINDLTYILKNIEVSSRCALSATVRRRTDSFIAKSVVKADSHLSVRI